MRVHYCMRLKLPGKKLEGMSVRFSLQQLLKSKLVKISCKYYTKNSLLTTGEVLTHIPQGTTIKYNIIGSG